MRFALVVAVILAGCAYKAASSTETTREVTSERPASRPTRVGCLEIGVDRRGDLGMAAVVHYAVDNHCEQAASVDLGWASVIGRTAEGAELALVPAHVEIALEVPAHGSRETAVAYPTPAPIGQLCVDVSTLAPRDHEAVSARWRCFGNPEAVASR